MSGLLDLATGGVWKYATIGVGALGLIVSAGIGIDDYVTHRERDSDAKALTAANAKIGFDTARITTLQASIDSQNAQIDAASKIGKAKLDAASTLVAGYQSQNAGLTAQVHDLINKPLIGATPCARMDDADRRILEDLK